MVNCRKTIAFLLLLSLVLLVSVSAVFAETKDEHALALRQARAISNQAPPDQAQIDKAQAQAAFEAKLAAAIEEERKHTSRQSAPLDARKAPEGVALPAQTARSSVLLTEGFESGSVPPAGWSNLVTNGDWTWVAETIDPFEGTYHADCQYDPDLTPVQDEWLYSPSLDLSAVSSDIRVEFYWFMSYYWGVDPFNNYDIEVWASTDGGATFPDKLWDESAQGVFTNWAYYKAVVSLSAYMGESDVVLGFRYYGSDGAEASLDFINVTDDAPPELGPGNDCSDPVKVDLPSDMPYANMNMTCGRGNSYSGTCLDPYDGGEDIVYEITVTSPVTVDITLDPLGTTYTGMALDDACPPDGSCLATANNGGSSAPYAMHGVSLAAGTYYLIIDTWPTPDCIPNFELTIDNAAPTEPGDNCSDPLKIDIPSLPYHDYGQTTCGRIDDYDATCLGFYDGGEDIIYEVTVTSPVTVDITLDPLGTDYTGIVIDAVCPPGSAGCLGTSTSSGTTAHTIYNVSLAPGTYYIMVDTWPAPDCIPSFDLHITESGGGPANDNWEDAEKVDDIVDYPFCTAGASFDGSGACNSCPNVWFCYTASCDGRVTVDLCGSGYDTYLGVYDGCGEPLAENLLVCNDDYCGLQSGAEFIAVAGNEYLIEISGYNCGVGCGDISISCAELCQVSCPPGATDEGEPCGSDTNGGCNSPEPVFRNITCGETVCGTAWFDGSTRDTDWYKLVLDGYYEVTWTVQAEFEALIGPLEVLVPGDADCGNLTGFINPAGFPAECEEGSVTVLLGPGEHLFFVAPLFGNIVACPGDYWAKATCVPAEAQYCDAGSSVCDEFISNVVVGSISNPSGCSNYADYTGLSTAMTIGSSYPITVSNGPPFYDGDQCGIWVDWNQDQDFFDADEMIVVAGTPGLGPYTASITPPAGALEGPTRMRIRIMWLGAVSPCGNTDYGEVEDYTVIVEAGGGAPLQMALDPDPVYAVMAYPIDPQCVDIYVGGEIAPGYGPGDVSGSSLLINSSLPAVQSEVLPSHEGFDGPVLHICVDMASFVGGYGILYGTSTQHYTVSGEMSDATPFDIGDDFTFRGHRAGDVNRDDAVNVLDLTAMVNRIFRGGAQYADPVNADVNLDGAQGNVIDLTFMVSYIFRGGPAPMIP